MPETRAQILRLLKARGHGTLGELAGELDGTTVNARQQLAALIKSGWVPRIKPREPQGKGRPPVEYALTDAGDHLFEKNYDSLSLMLIETLQARFGDDALLTAMESITDSNVAQWDKALRGKSLHKRLETLKGIYFADDPHTFVETHDDGPRLVETNCPYLHVAQREPRMCSITLSTLSRLLGYRVVREQRFQDGDRRCVFRVCQDQPVDPATFRFALEDGDT